jgi:hypothetical protein
VTGSRPLFVMEVVVEPRDRRELDRLITALLNATGVVKQVLDTTKHPPEADGVAVIGLVAERLRDTLAVLAEHRGDKDLALATEVLAESTSIVAGHLGLDASVFGD